MTDPPLPRAAVAGTNLRYELTGDGPVVVFVHGFSLDLRMWEDQLAALRPRFRVLRFDLRGSGGSDPVVLGAAYREIDDLHALLHYLAISKVHLVGLSAGGLVALQFALQYPDLVDRLVLADSTVDGFDWGEEFPNSWDRIERVARTEGVDAARRLWLAHPFFDAAREQPEVRRRLEEIVGDYSGWEWIHESPARGIVPPAGKRLGTVRQPTLVLVGERDIPDFRRISSKLATEIPGAELAVVPGAGHMVNMEAPEEFNRRLLRFLDAPHGPPAGLRA